MLYLPMLTRCHYFLLLSLLITAFTPFQVQGQSFRIEEKRFSIEKGKGNRVVIPFEVVQNLVVVKVFLNDSDTLKFILDTGVGHTLLTKVYMWDTYQIHFLRKIPILGLGEGDTLQVWHAVNNTIRFPEGLVANNQDVLMTEEDIFHLSSMVGMPVNGLIGYDFFASGPVLFDYARKQMVIYDPDYFEKKRRKLTRRMRKLPIELNNRKPYIQTSIADQNGKNIDVKLLIDSGASSALSLYKLTNSQITVPDASLHTYLGVGLMGEIFGEVGRVNSFNMGGYKLKAPVASYPDLSGIKHAMMLANRNGSLGGDILKRFDVLFDYNRGEMWFKPNKFFSKPFRYNMSGLELAASIPGLPVYHVEHVRPNSPAAKAGVAKGDEILAVNGINVFEYELGEVIDILQGKPGKRVSLSVKRGSFKYRFKFVLEDSI